MKQNLSLSLFVICVLLANIYISTKSSLKSKANSKAKSSSKYIDVETLNTLFNTYFSKPRASGCSAIKVTEKEKDEDKDEPKEDEPKTNGWGRKLKSFRWMRKWGRGEVAYLIDYLEALFKDEFINETKKILKETSNFKRDVEKYDDPFDMKLLTKATPSEANMKKINPSWDYTCWTKSFSAGQLKQSIKKFQYPIDLESSDPARSFIVDFDKNGDGRLDFKEYVIGIIYSVKKNKGTICYNCYFWLSKKLTALFNYIDCAGAGVINAQQIFEKLPDLKRPKDAGCNHFVGDKALKRTGSINDFVLKNSSIYDGAVTAEEFSSGILLGFVERFVLPYDIVEDDCLSMKSKRC